MLLSPTSQGSPSNLLERSKSADKIRMKDEPEFTPEEVNYLGMKFK